MKRLPLLRVFEFFVPRHLDRLQLRLVGRRRIVREALKLNHVTMQIGEPHRQRVHVAQMIEWLKVGLGDSDVKGGVKPDQCGGVKVGQYLAV
jgi:hypothetical protein